MRELELHVRPGDAPAAIFSTADGKVTQGDRAGEDVERNVTYVTANVVVLGQGIVDELFGQMRQRGANSDDATGANECSRPKGPSGFIRHMIVFHGDT